MSAPTARARVRAELTQEILEAAKAQLAEHGAAALSLRAVARDVGMVSSAVYRYFPSRDHLLTALIVDAYNGLGAAVEEAVEPLRPRDLDRRWSTICRAVREWALANPHEYALIYGSPVPGYEAPVTTIGPATRVALVLVQLLVDAGADGALRETPLVAPLPRPVHTDLARLRDVFADAPDAVIVRALTAWSALFGLVSFELFGQFHNVIAANREFFETAVRELADFVGLPAGTSKGPKRQPRT
ncbi:MAG: TetR/AcrR family transcriptional regulator [Acidimicrobiia bacterium]